MIRNTESGTERSKSTDRLRRLAGQGTFTRNFGDKWVWYEYKADSAKSLWTGRFIARFTTSRLPRITSSQRRG